MKKFSFGFKSTSLAVIVTFLVNTIFQNGALAGVGIGLGSAGTQSGNVAGQMTQISEATGVVQNFQADLFTGRAQTSVPIFVPPGRKNIQPSLALGYSSSGGSSWCGMGWNLDLGYIARDVKRGVPKYDSSDKYVFSFQGVNSELVSVGTNEYRAKDEALFLKVVNDTTNNKWTVTDKSGTVYTFGDASGTRQAGPGSSTFKWLLAKVKDTSGNYMTITYTTDSGQPYLSTIEYNGNETQSFAHSHKVEFTLEARTDTSISYITGARVTQAKRLANIQVKVKDGSGTYQLARKYVMAYSYSDSTKRSLLDSVTEYGTDGTTSLPAVTFTYTAKTKSFPTATQINGIEDLSTQSKRNVTDGFQNASHDTYNHADLIDVNGDGLPDRVLKDTESDTNVKWQKNTGSAFVTTANYSTNLDNLSSSAVFGWIRGVQDPSKTVCVMQDINGDGLVDRIMCQDGDTNNRWRVQLNNGAGFDNKIDWTNLYYNSDANMRNISQAYKDTANDFFYQTDFQDMNGDGYPDRIVKQTDSTTVFKVQLSDGSGSFANAVDWGTIDYLTDSHKWGYIRTAQDPYKVVCTLQDINGDGLPDRIMTDEDTHWHVQMNNGSGFDTVEAWSTIEVPTGAGAGLKNIVYAFRPSGGSNSYTQADFFDINGDGLPDRVMKYSNTATDFKVQINNGHGFESIESWTGLDLNGGADSYSYVRAVQNPTTVVLDLADVNGDGLPDRVFEDQANTYWKAQLGSGKVPDMLLTVNNGRNGTTTITYSPSTIYDNTDTNGKQRLPFPVQVVSQVDQADGMGNTYSTTYSYKGGLFDAANREFRGFKETTVTDAIGTKTISTFGQTDTLKGKLLEKDVKDSLNNLFTKEVTTWATSNPYTGVNFTYVDTVDSYIYDGDTSYKQIQQVFTYDSYGNLASTTEYGDTSVSTDSRKTVNTYVYDTTDYIVNTLEKTTLYDTDLTTIKAEKYFYYDGATSITTAPTAGLLTKEEEWLSTASGCGTAGTCTNNPKTTMTYDSYGNLATVQDARGYTTTNTYESTYHLFLTQISNTLSQTRGFTYNEKLAQILTSTDANSQVTETQYDVLGRVTKVIAPLDSSSEPTQTFDYTYSNTANTPNKVTTTVKTSVPGATYTYLTVYTFTDGLGREIQKRSPAENSSYQMVTGCVNFTNRGQVYQQWNPYTQTTSSSYSAPSSSDPKATMTYDAVGRRTRIDYADSTYSTVAFSDFVKTTTDPRGKQIVYTNDAYGRLVKVEEKNSGATYTTTYEYDVLNNLKKTTDNSNNQTTITYDSLSRKTAMTDPDMGSWTYAYDLNDNLTSQVDAKSQTISFTYDALNRVTLKDLPTGETDVTYDYDSAPSSYTGQTGYWVGRLAKVTDASGTHEFKYDKQGRVLDDTKTVDSTGYSFARTYDSMGRVRTLTYPDTEVVTYAYNNMGEVETIQGVKSSVTTDYVKDVNYNAAGQITYLKYGNDVTSDYTYNSNTLRLSNILTKKPDGTTKLQDLTYTFDNNGNVTHLADAVNSNTQDFTYDDLNRLVTASGSAYGNQSFTYNAIGNMTNKNGMTMTYSGSGAGPHAVTSVSGSASIVPTYCHEGANTSFTYDANGNMTVRGSDTLSYDSENRIKEVKAYDGGDQTQNYTLQPGWNMVSFTYLPANKSITSVLSSLTFGTDYDQISYWDPVSSTWKHFVNDADFNDFNTFEYGRTYEIYVTNASAVNFSVTGKSPGIDITGQIKTGDNFISPMVQSSTAVTTVLSGLTQGTHYSDVKRLNASTGLLESYQGGAFTNFEPGKGYIIVGLQNCSFSYGKTETTTTFVYDSTGSRVKKTSGSTTTVYFGKDYEKQGSTTTKYIFLGDRRISLKDSTGTLYYFHEDQINSSNVITDSSGNSVALYEYDPYGATVTHTGSASVKHKFTGQEEDDSTHLYNYGNRYYDPQIGRFVTADWTISRPSDPQDLNRYTYARNNPIIYNDPTGLTWLSKLLGAIFGIFITAISGGNFVLGFAAFAALDRGVDSLQKGVSFGKAVLGANITFAISFVAGSIVGPAADKLFGPVGDMVGSKIGQILNVTAGNLAKLAVNGAAQGAAQGGFSAGAETALYGGSPKQIANSSINGAFTGAIVGGIIAPAGYLVGEIGKSFRTKVLESSGKSYRYVGEEEAELIRTTGKVPNVNAKGEAKLVYYTQDKPIDSAFGAKTAYNLEVEPTHRVEINTKGVNSSRTTKVDGGTGTQRTTAFEVPGKKVEKLGG